VDFEEEEEEAVVVVEDNQKKEVEGRVMEVTVVQAVEGTAVREANKN
jgi:hypothetical protein